MKLPPFTLVHRLADAEGTEGTRTAVAARRMLLESAANPVHINFASTLKRRFNHTLINTSFARAPIGCSDALVYSEALPAYECVLADLERRDKVITVGLWELGTNAGYLPWLIERLNAAQSFFTFFKIHAAIPAGIVSRSERVRVWARRLQEQGYELTGQRDEITDNIIAEDFFDRGELVRKEIGLDYLIGNTPSMVAGIDDDEVYWNHLSVSHGRTILASSYGMHIHAHRARRPYEVAIAVVAIAQLLATLNPRVDFHDDTGCIFDYNERHESIIKVLRRPMIEARCLEAMAPRYQTAALELVSALGTYERVEHEATDASTADTMNPLRKEN